MQEEAVLNVIRTADAIGRSFDTLFKTYGLTRTQYNVLRILRGAGEKGACCSQIGDRLITAEPDVTRLLDRLERRGWIQRRRDAEDRRSVTTRITASGLKLLASLDEPVQQLNCRPFDLLGDADIQRLIAQLEKVRESLHSST
jgi:DNA-binding MarR family transcriptional regulator